MATASGRMDRTITIQRSAAGTDAFNAEVLTWTDLITVSAERVDLSDKERFGAAFEKSKAAQVGSFALARFRVRSSSITRTVTARDRLSHDGATWNIMAAPSETLEGRKRFLWITAARDTD